jgi:peptide/nickel transport system substrate-binding protein
MVNVNKPDPLTAAYIQSFGCVIATATFGSELSPEVQFLRTFRDQKVMVTFAGSQFMVVFNASY